MTELSYRDFRPDDFVALHDIVSHWNVTSNLGNWPWPPDPEFTKSRCRPFYGDGFVWAIVANARVIGSVGVTTGELGYMLHPEAHGRGFISRAVRDALYFAFHDLEAGEVRADIWADNQISRRVLKRAGFVLIRQEILHAKARNEPTASETYRLDRESWQDLSARSQSFTPARHRNQS
ncbi:MAG: GNAT family N-acetyltransferase [Arenibacterium sp.]